MKFFLPSGGCLLALLWYSSCQNQWSPDSWYRSAPGNISRYSNSGQLLGQILQFVEVSDAFEKQAETLLRSKSAVLISMAQANQMSGGKYHASKNKPFLVRAVYFNKPTGSFEVIRKGNDLFVRHSSLGPSMPMQRQGLIVDLSQAPRMVYIDCTIAQ